MNGSFFNRRHHYDGILGRQGFLSWNISVRNADRILVLDHGKIVQQGKHEELIE
ncbi:MAG: hypothetical protein ACI4HQ_08830 [Acetatifactor sp.]